MNIKDHAYQGNPVAYKVIVAGIDVSALDIVASISEVSLVLDYPLLHAYRPGDCQVILNDPTGDFAKDNPNNFFVRNNRPQDGFQVDVEVHAGYIVENAPVLELLLKGRITKVSQEGDEGTTTIIASDKFDDLFSEDVEDFGVDRHFKLSLGPADNVHGTYPIPDFALPASKGSVEVEKNAGEHYTEVEELSETGSYERENYVVDNEGVKSEYVEFPDAASGYPRFNGKTAYRDRDVRRAVLDILEHIDFTEHSIDFPKIQRPLHLSRDERIGYRALGNPNENAPATEDLYWKGFPTGMIHDDGVFYIVYNSPSDVVGVERNPSLLLKYEVATDDWTVLYRRSARGASIGARGLQGTEFIDIAKEGTKIAILCTDSALELNPVGADAVPDQVVRPIPGSYDCTELVPGTETSDNRTYILVFDEADGSVQTLVPQNADAKLQLGYHYILGATPEVNIDGLARSEAVNRVLPDNHRTFTIHNGMLYYVYGKSNAQKHYGVARVPIGGGTVSELFQIESDGVSHMGCNFIIEGNTLYFIGTNRESVSSEIFVVSRRI